MTQKGFTIKELLMVVVVIGLLCAFAIPEYYALRAAKSIKPPQNSTLLAPNHEPHLPAKP